MRFSIVTATYNRETIVSRAIDSALNFIRGVADAEAIVIDDASIDGTVAMIKTRYAQELASGTLKLLERRKNGGSTLAKADGARVARGDWLVFLNSDDELLPDASTNIPAFVATHSKAPVFFFRCVDQYERPIGPAIQPKTISYEDFVAALPRFATPGECLPVISRRAFLEFPPDEYVQGFELMPTIKILRKYGSAMLSNKFARRYHLEGADRLTSRNGNLRRANLLVRGLRRMLDDFGDGMSAYQRFKVHIRIICYASAAASGFGQRR